MLFIICMIIGVLLCFFGCQVARISIQEIHDPGSPGVLILAIVMIWLGMWMSSNAIECYQYIIEHNAMELFF